MASEDVKLIGAWPSPFVMRARIALNIKSVGYEFHQEQMGGKTELLLKSNPLYKKIPVLIHGDKTICESLIIVQYIDGVWASGPSILPSDPYELAIASFWSYYIDDKLFPTIKSIPMLQGDAKKAAVQQVFESLALLEDAFIKCSKGKNFFGGNHIGYLDISLGSLLGWLKVLGMGNNVMYIDEAKTPNLAKWQEKFCSDSVVKDVMPETQKLAEFGKVLMASMMAQAKPK